MNILKTEFDKLILNSVNNNHIQESSFYYDSIYTEELKRQLKKKGVFEKFEKRELKEVAPGKVKMCSVASSSRLCFLHFYEKENIDLECSLSTGTKGNAQLDAVNGSVFYECKCHEIFDEHDHLSIAYKKNLIELFGIICNASEDGSFCNLTLKDFEINHNKSIYQLSFDMKQFLCHLFGISKNGGGTLQYIFFIPDNELIQQNNWCIDVYKKLDEEINMIWNSPKIKSMIAQNNIALHRPLKIEVSKIEDFVMENL